MVGGELARDERMVAEALEHGRVVTAGPPAEVLTAELIAEVYGVRAHVTRDEHSGRPTVAFRTGSPERVASR